MKTPEQIKFLRMACLSYREKSSEYKITFPTKEEKKRLILVIAEALSIQDLFLPEPIFTKTGKGYLKSEGVAPLIAIKEAKPRD